MLISEDADSFFLGSVNVQRLVEHGATWVALEMVLFVSHLMLALRKLSNRRRPHG